MAKKNDPLGPDKRKKGSIISPKKKNQKHVTWASIITWGIFLYFLFTYLANRGN